MPGKKAKLAKKKPVAKSAPKLTAKPAAKIAKPGGAIVSLKKILGFGKGSKGAAVQPKKASATVKTAPKLAIKKGQMTKPLAKPATKLAAKPTMKPLKPVPGKAVVAKPAGKGPVVQTGKGSKAVADSVAKAPARAVVSGPPVCREVACELISTTGGYCRMHYIKNWKKIKRKEMILKERKLNHYIEELVSKYPDKYIEAIRQDLASEKDFAKVIADLEIEEGLDDFESVETETAEGIIDNLKRDFEDDGDVF